MTSSQYRQRVIVATLCATVLAVIALVVVMAPEVAQAGPEPRPVKVMTRNLYLGASLTPAINAGSIPELAAAGTQIWNTVLATDFPERAKVLAYEIADADPDLIGLQEAAIWRTGPPDGPPIPPFNGSPATTVVFDYLQLLLDELDAIGTPYVVVYSLEEADIESITLPFPITGFDIRLTQRDVILAKKSKVDAGELMCTNAQGAHYPPQIQLNLPLLGVPVESTRGYVSADCIVNKRAFRFVNTHLEAFSAGFRALQAGFLAQLGPASDTSQPVVLVGDLNSDPNDTSSSPPDPTPNNAAINLLIDTFGYVDTWAELHGDADGFTSGFNEFVDDPDASGLSKRIDHVMTRPLVEMRESRVTGTDPDNRTPGGLWPSDHAGLITTLAP
jgi:endonuclease/exonuclease/phosphatase family metal-dependent hydrolase